MMMIRIVMMSMVLLLLRNKGRAASSPGGTLGKLPELQIHS